MIYNLIIDATYETLVMVFFSGLFSLIMGLPLGIVLAITQSEENGGLVYKPVLNKILSRVINMLRSFPFLILMIVLFPLSRIIIGTSIGTKATIVPLSIAAAPFVARVIESSLKEVSPGAILASRAMGSTNFQIITKVMIPEALPSLVNGLTLTLINLIGYSAMAGVIGGGGLGDLAIRYGYQRFRTDIMIVSVIVIIILVEVIQTIGNLISSRLLAKR